MPKPTKPSSISRDQLELPDSPCNGEATSETPPCAPERIVLIDMENVQPDNLSALESLPFSVYVFTGENQSKISLDFAAAMQNLGKRAAYVRMAGNGPNALDFHIAYYVGELAAKSASAQFYIVSKDKGFDPLIKHLACRDGRTINIKRVGNIEAIVKLCTTDICSTDSKINTIVGNLSARGLSRPRKVKTLSNTINNLFGGTLSDADRKALLKLLQTRGLINMNGQSVSYTLPGKS